MEWILVYAITILIIRQFAKYLNKIVVRLILFVNAGGRNLPMYQKIDLDNTTPPIITGSIAALVKAAIGFGLVWLGSFLFTIFQLEFNIWLVIIIGVIAFHFNSDLYNLFPDSEPKFPYARPVEYMLKNVPALVGILETYGAIAGVIIGGLILL